MLRVEPLFDFANQSVLPIKLTKRVDDHERFVQYLSILELLWSTECVAPCLGDKTRPALDGHLPGVEDTERNIRCKQKQYRIMHYTL